jgi:putative exporter of polyketide antibiotics
MSLPSMIAAVATCLPVAAMFLGKGALAFSAALRQSAGVAYGLVVLAFVWELFGSSLSAPHWLLELTTFEHTGLVVPGRAADGGSIAAMLGVAAGGALMAAALLRRRDLVGR